MKGGRGAGVSAIDGNKNSNEKLVTYSLEAQVLHEVSLSETEPNKCKHVVSSALRPRPSKSGLETSLQTKMIQVICCYLSFVNGVSWIVTRQRYPTGSLS